MVKYEGFFVCLFVFCFCPLLQDLDHFAINEWKINSHLYQNVLWRTVGVAVHQLNSYQFKSTQKSFCAGFKSDCLSLLPKEA